MLVSLNDMLPSIIESAGKVVANVGKGICGCVVMQQRSIRAMERRQKAFQKEKYHV